MAEQNTNLLPQPAATGSASPSTTDVIGSIIQQVGSEKPTVPMNVSTPVATAPNVTPPQIRNQNQNTNVQPMRDNAMSERRAIKHNNFAMITNALNSYANQKNVEHYETLKRNIEDIAVAQQQIGNAEAALKNNPNDAEAKNVLEQNKRFIEGKFADKKLTKQLQKAFDVNFTDPTKNNTPEIKAAQDAIKSVQAKTQAGLDHNTPQEQKVAQSAQQPQQQQSQTPLADKFLSSRPAALTTNPEFARQQSQIMAQQKAVYEKVLPAAINQMARENVARLHEEGAMQRAVKSADTAMKIAAAKFSTQLAVGASHDKAAMDRQIVAGRQAMARTIVTANTALQIAADKRIAGTWKAQAAKEQALGVFDKQIGEVNTANKFINEQLLLLEPRASKGDEAAKRQVDELKNQRDFNNFMISQYTDNRQKMANEIFGTPVGGNPTGNTKGYVKDANKPTGNTSEKPARPVVAGPPDDSASDTESDEEDRAIDDPSTAALIDNLITEE
jgi:hypothetical protein